VDSAADDIALAALDPIAALRTRVDTLTTALSVALIALSCYGQKESFVIKAAQEIHKINELKEAWRD
jgi:hypothetical protein